MNPSILFLLLGLGSPAAAGAAPQCAARVQVLDMLATKYSETRRSIGIAADQTVMEVFASETGSWTLTVTAPNGMTCLIGAGQNYETVTETLPPQGTEG